MCFFKFIHVCFPIHSCLFVLFFCFITFDGFTVTATKVHLFTILKNQKKREHSCLFFSNSFMFVSFPYLGLLFHKHNNFQVHTVLILNFLKIEKRKKKWIHSCLFSHSFMFLKFIHVSLIHLCFFNSFFKSFMFL